MKLILFTLSIASLFIMSYLSGMVMMTDRKITFMELYKNIPAKGNEKLFGILYGLTWVSIMTTQLIYHFK